uniref:ShKT domain-containing protein n=1 Tax=Haemonchus placei TaxID=6290 RepID=A0A0N4VTK4_HAEPC
LKYQLRKRSSTSEGCEVVRWYCTTEEDQKGALCEIWAQSGLCQAHRPTMFLFCRKTCLCGGDPALD